MITNATKDLLARLADLLRGERCSMTGFLVALAEFDARRCWIELGYASLFEFLHRELGLSKGTAFYRKTAAELIQRFPEIVAPLRDGRLCITAVHALSRAITPENRADVLPRFFHLSNLLAARGAYGDRCVDRYAESMRTRTYRDPPPAPAPRTVLGSGPPPAGGLT